MFLFNDFFKASKMFVKPIKKSKNLKNYKRILLTNLRKTNLFWAVNFRMGYP